MKLWLLGVVIVLAAFDSLHSIALAASIPSKSEVDDRSHIEQQDEEQQLESLKSPIDTGNLEVVKTGTETFSNINGKMKIHSEKETSLADRNSGQVMVKVKQDVVKTADSEDSKPKTVVKTELDIPSKGIHEVAVDKKAKLDALYMPSAESSSDDYYSPFDGIQYTPMDMAEYILKTGDDEGVSMAIEELMRGGMLARNEAVAYLEEIKSELEYLWEKMSMERRLAASYNRKPTLSPIQKMDNNNQPLSLHSMFRPLLSRPSTPKPFMKTQDKGLSNKAQKPRALEMKNTLETTEDDDNIFDTRMELPTLTNSMQSQNAEYNELLERLRIADFLYKEYSLEEVIYQLAKEMFTQSVIKGNQDAEESLQRFSSFLQEETSKGRISKDLEAKIIEVMMAALMDVVSSQPGIPPEMNRNQVPSTKTVSKELKENKSDKFRQQAQLERAKPGNKSFPLKHPTVDKESQRATVKSSQQNKT